MKNNVDRKSMVIVTIFLLFGAVFLPTIRSDVATLKIENKNSSIDEPRGSTPTMVDATGKTKFYGVFVGVPFDKEAQDMADALDQYPGWTHENKTVLKDNNATGQNITDAIEKLQDTAEAGDEVVIYFGTHGADNTRKDGKKDHGEADADPKDEPNGFDNHIEVADGETISDDELTELISGFAYCVTITVIIDSCYSGTFTDGSADLPSAENGNTSDDKYGKTHLAVMTASKAKTPTRSATQKSFTDEILDGLKKNGTTTKADKNNDKITTSKELFLYANKKMSDLYWGDNDFDGKFDEDNVDYYYDPETGESGYLKIDNDGDGLIDEDIAPTFPFFWGSDEWYVDDDAGPGGDGSKEYPFDTIQEAIDTSNEGDKIIVADGNYQEHIEIEINDLELIGSYRGTYDPTGEISVINGGNLDNVCRIYGDNTKISGFVFRGCGSFEEDAAIDIHSDYNIITGNIIENNKGTGINLQDSANYNYIYGNTIQNNDGAGIFSWESSNNNYIHRNNFINNGWFNAKDYCVNIWDDAYNLAGNYWDDWNGSGTYKILGGSNEDRYPFANKNGWNEPPDPPEIIGMTRGKAGSEYEYEFYIGDDEKFGPGSDPFHDFVYCFIDWGDGSEDIIGPYRPYVRGTVNHTWNEEGTYTIQAKTIDQCGNESSWSTLEVSMPKGRLYLFRIIEQIILRFPLLETILKTQTIN
jgi:parallel beta-helix repeat protein